LFAPFISAASLQARKLAHEHALKSSVEWHSSQFLMTDFEKNGVPYPDEEESRDVKKRAKTTITSCTLSITADISRSHAFIHVRR